MPSGLTCQTSGSGHNQNVSAGSIPSFNGSLMGRLHVRSQIDRILWCSTGDTAWIIPVNDRPGKKERIHLYLKRSGEHGRVTNPGQTALFLDVVGVSARSVAACGVPCLRLPGALYRLGRFLSSYHHQKTWRQIYVTTIWNINI